MSRSLPLLLVFMMLLLCESCAFRGIRRTKHIVYQAQTQAFPAQELNVFAPQNRPDSAPVMLFIHGGNWRSGSKELYSWFGSRLARRGIVAVVIDYPLSPAGDYAAQARYSALAYRWAQAKIAAYGGNPDRIFLAGHSSGGHLAALLGTDTSWLGAAGVHRAPAGLVLIDAAGLNMYAYLEGGGLNDAPTYPATFGTDPDAWIKATPMRHIHRGIPPVLMLSGGRSYPSIVSSNDTFAKRLEARHLSFRHIFQPRRKHVPMITQFFNTANPRYRDLLHFLRSSQP